MEHTLKTKWVSALRSGEFQQFRGRLCNQAQDAFCCLGVLATITDETVDLRDSECEVAIYDHLDRLVGGKITRTELVTMNDNDGKSFPEIADWVEKNISVNSDAG